MMAVAKCATWRHVSEGEALGPAKGMDKMTVFQDSYPDDIQTVDFWVIYFSEVTFF